MADDTLFDKILRREVPSEMVHEDEDVYAFADISPQAPVHVLVVPKIKRESFADFTEAEPAEIGRFMRGVARVAAKLGLEENGYRVVFNTGRDALQSVQYVHAHILGGRRLAWPPG